MQTGTVTVVVRDLPTATITGSDSICQYEEYPEIEFTGTLGDPSYTFSYSVNGTAQTVSSGENNNAVISVPTEEAGTFVYTLNQVEESGLGCSQDLSENVTVVVHPLPEPSFDPTPSRIIMSENTAQMVNSSLGAESYIWTFPDGSTSNNESPFYSFDIEYVGQEFTILLEAISEYGCKDSTKRTVVSEEDLLIYVPNTFTPNKDGLNDVFLPQVTEGVDPQDYSLRIFNRWGELIFETRNLNQGWDGTYQGKVVKDGSYVWQMEFKKKDDIERVIKTGSVNLLR
jgi:gliding motility-associated-like protein